MWLWIIFIRDYNHLKYTEIYWHPCINIEYMYNFMVKLPMHTMFEEKSTVYSVSLLFSHKCQKSCWYFKECFCSSLFWIIYCVNCLMHCQHEYFGKYSFSCLFCNPYCSVPFCYHAIYKTLCGKRVFISGLCKNFCTPLPILHYCTIPPQWL